MGHIHTHIHTQLLYDKEKWLGWVPQKPVEDAKPGEAKEGFRQSDGRDEGDGIYC